MASLSTFSSTVRSCRAASSAILASRASLRAAAAASRSASSASRAAAAASFFPAAEFSKSLVCLPRSSRDVSNAAADLSGLADAADIVKKCVARGPSLQIRETDPSAPADTHRPPTQSATTGNPPHSAKTSSLEWAAGHEGLDTLAKGEGVSVRGGGRRRRRGMI